MGRGVALVPPLELISAHDIHAQAHLQSLLEAVISQVPADGCALSYLGSQHPVCLAGIWALSYASGQGMDATRSMAAVNTSMPVQACLSQQKTVSKAASLRSAGRRAREKLVCREAAEKGRTLTCCWGSC